MQIDGLKDPEFRGYIYESLWQHNQQILLWEESIRKKMVSQSDIIRIQTIIFFIKDRVTESFKFTFRTKFSQFGDNVMEVFFFMLSICKSHSMTRVIKFETFIVFSAFCSIQLNKTEVLLFAFFPAFSVAVR